MTVSFSEAFLVREVREGDAVALAPLLEEVGFPTAEDALVDRIGRMSGAEFGLVAELDGAPVGVLTVHSTSVLHRPEPVARITLLVVAAEARGRGVGRSLVEEAERRAAKRGCRLIEVISNKRYAGAHPFYEGLGYELTSYKFKKMLEATG